MTNALLIGYERNATPPVSRQESLDDYVEAEAERRAKGPYDADEVDYHLDALRQHNRLIAKLINDCDAIALLHLIKTEFGKRRQDYHESEVLSEINKNGAL